MNQTTHLVVDVVVVVHLEVLDPLHSPALHDVRCHLVHLLPLRLRFCVTHLTKFFFPQDQGNDFSHIRLTEEVMQAL